MLYTFPPSTLEDISKEGRRRLKESLLGLLGSLHSEVSGGLGFGAGDCFIKELPIVHFSCL